MSLAVDIALSGVRVPVSRARLTDVARAALRADGVRDALISITFVDTREITRLNREHLNHRGPTDVISFGFVRASSADPVVGDIYIAPDVARAQARDRGISVREEIIRLVVHGVLHVLGHEHPEDESRERSPMWQRQERLVRQLASQRP